ncbi:MAG: ATP-binding protein [Bacteroidota bacterium]
MKQATVLLLILFGAWYTSLANANSIIILDHTPDSIGLRPIMLVYEDSTWNTPYETIQNRPFSAHDSIPSFRNESAYWVRFSIRNTQLDDTITLYYPFFTSLVTGVYWAEVRASSVEKKWKKMGGRTSTIWNASYQQHKQYAKLVIPPNSQIDYDIGMKYKHYHSDFKSSGLPTQLWSKRHLLKRLRAEYFVLRPSIILRSIFLSISALIFFINLFQFFFNQDRAYLFYALYVLFLFLFYALFSEENAIFNNRIFFGRYFSPLYEYLNIIFYSAPPIAQLLFFRSFLDSPTYNKKLDKWLSVGMYVLIGLLVIDLIYFAIFGEQQTYQYVKDARFVVLLFCVLYPIYLIYQSRGRLSRIVATGASFLVLFSLAGSFYKYTPDTIVDYLPYVLTVSNNYAILGALIEFVFFSAGLGYRMRIVEQRNQQLRNKVELEQMRKQFYTNITHELRTPLTLIIAPLQQILNGGKTNNLNLQHKRMLRNAQRLLQLINQLLNISKQEDVRSDLQLVTKEIQSFLRAIVFSFESIAVRKQIELQANFPTTQFVQIDTEKLESILSNLLSNAFKFTLEGGKVRFEAKVERQKLHLSISDTGIGIATTEIPYIFDRFYQVNHTQQLEGSGIGLWTVKQLIADYHGTIKVQSQLGEGTSFDIVLPIIRAISEKNQSESIKLNTEELKIGTANSNEKPQILLAEDNEDLRAYIVETLSEKYSVVEAKDGYAAWLLAKEILPDLIITDLMMPQMDGLALTERLRNSHITDHIPIIILTAKSYQSDKIEGLQKGAEAYLTKPF